MVKLFKKYLLLYQINNLEYNIEIKTEYPNVYKELLETRKISLYNNKKAKIYKYLNKLEVDTLTKEEYIEVFIVDKIAKINHKYHLKTLVLTQKAKRNKITNLEEQLEILKQKETTEITNYINKLAKLYKEKDLIETKILYEVEKNKKYGNLIEYEASLIEENKLKLEKLTSKYNNDVTILKEKLILKKQALKTILDETKEEVELADDTILSIRNLTMNFGGLKAVDNLTVDVKKGEIFGLIGPNGAGKTTVFNCITQFYKANEGKIYYRNPLNEIVPLNNIKVHNVIKEGISRTFQNVELIYELTILENMLVGAHSLFRSSFFSHSLQSKKYKREEQILKNRALKILTDLNLVHYKDFYPIGLPYGVLKRVELARTLITNPNLIILDEPAAGLNETETVELAKIIKNIQKEYNTTIFLVEHDMGLVMSICDTVCAINFGKMLAVGKPSEIQNNKQVQEAYLGGE